MGAPFIVSLEAALTKSMILIAMKDLENTVHVGDIMEMIPIPQKENVDVWSPY